ncbi:MAG: DUF4349 domain-containing protein [Planctomycetes bacterium]|nr:DUF4349 domain-containing protein [Planctomycetota bacterium]
MRSFLMLIVFVLPICTGCGSAEKAPRVAVGMKDAAKRGEAPQAPQDQAANEHFVGQDVPGGKQQPKEPAPPGQKKPKVEQPRKIKYTADLKVIVKDFDKSWDDLKTLIKETRTITAHEEINNSPGSQRNGTFRLRVPVEKLDSFRDGVVKLGDVERNTLQSEDITAAYFDLDAEIKNKQAERDAVRKLLEKTGDRDLQQFFTVKRELDNITRDINMSEGRLKLWANLTDLTTVSVQLRERQKTGERKPDDRPAPQDFGTRAETTWTESWDLFVGFLQSVAIVAIAVTPWLPVPLVLALLLWVCVKVLVWLTRAPVAKAAPNEKT